MPESTIILSAGTLLGLMSFFYTFNKDSKETAKQIQKLETEVEGLKEHKQDIKEIKTEIDSLKLSTSSIQQTIVRIDTNVQNMMNSNKH